MEIRNGLSTPSHSWDKALVFHLVHLGWNSLTPGIRCRQSQQWGLVCLHPHKHLNIVAWKAASRDWEGKGRLGITASQPLLSAYSQEINDCRSQYHALSPFEVDSYRFRFWGPRLKQTILEWSTRTSELAWVVPILFQAGSFKEAVWFNTAHRRAISAYQHFPRGSIVPFSGNSSWRQRSVYSRTEAC